jgi:hypothetical protein
LQFPAFELRCRFQLASGMKNVYTLQVLQNGLREGSPPEPALGRVLRNRAGILAALIVLTTLPLSATDNDPYIREEFADLENWEPLEFPAIPRHTDYSIESEGDSHYLKAESSASSSGLIFTAQFDVYRYPKMRWRWKVDNVYTGEQVNKARAKEGDDYPIRIYIIFQYDPEQADPLQRLTYIAAKRRYGEYPPHSALNYVWASNYRSQSTMTNPYSSRSKMIFLRMGDEQEGRWVEESVDILEDYRRVFGKNPPATAGLAIMNDSDDTGQSSVSYVDFIEVYR